MNFSSITAAAGGLLFSTAVSSVGVFISWSILAYAGMIHHPSLPEVVAVGFSMLLALTFLTTVVKMGVLNALKQHEKDKSEQILQYLQNQSEKSD